jgi:hypothetical protein
MVAKFLIVRSLFKLFKLAPRSEEDEESEDKKKNRGKEASEDEGDKKKKKRDDKKESSIIFIPGSSEVNDLMKRVINYLLFVSKNVETYQWESNKELLIKIFDYLKDFKISNPIEFLKVFEINLEIKFRDYD